MDCEDVEREIKVIVVGNGGVGKTSMIRRFCKGIFTDEYKKTIGVDFLEKPLYVDSLGEEVRYMLWDTAGQEEFDSITRVYYRGAGAAVIAFSTTDRASFEAVETWKRKVEAECGEIAICIVQNKVDRVHEAVVTPEEVEALARRLKFKLYRTCVKDDVNVTEVFMYLAELHDKKVNNGTLGRTPQPIAVSKPSPAVPSSSQQPENEGSQAESRAQEQQQAQVHQQQEQQQQAHAAAVVQPQQEAKTIELRPNKERGKKKKGIASKFSSC